MNVLVSQRVRVPYRQFRNVRGVVRHNRDTPGLVRIVDRLAQDGHATLSVLLPEDFGQPEYHLVSVPFTRSETLDSR